MDTSYIIRDVVAELADHCHGANTAENDLLRDLMGDLETYFL